MSGNRAKLRDVAKTGRANQAPDYWSTFDYVPPDKRRQITEEETLLVAILHRALLDFAQVAAFKAGEARAHKEIRDMEDAVRWVRSSNTRPFSFHYCCWQGLGVDPALIRETVERHWRRLLTKEAAIIFATYTPPKDEDDADL